MSKSEVKKDLGRVLTKNHKSNLRLMNKLICKKLIITALIFYVFLLVFMFVFQRGLQYRPSGKMLSVSYYGLGGFREKILVTQDQQKILAWYKEPRVGQKMIVYFHGNSGNLGARAHKFNDFADSGFGVLAISYRGFAGSEGKPSEQGLIKDGEAAIKFLTDNNYQLQDLIFFGESLGSGVAVQMAAKFTPYALILESPYSSITAVAQRTYWFIPAGLLLRDKFESIKFAPKIAAPVLIFHGTKDRVVAYSEGKKLFKSFKSQKDLIKVKGAGHLDFTDDFLVDEMNKFLSNVITK